MIINKQDGYIEIVNHDAICPPDKKHSLVLNTIATWYRSNLNNKWRNDWHRGNKLVNLAKDSKTVEEFEEKVCQI